MKRMRNCEKFYFVECTEVLCVVFDMRNRGGTKLVKHGTRSLLDHLAR